MAKKWLKINEADIHNARLVVCVCVWGGCMSACVSMKSMGRKFVSPGRWCVCACKYVCVCVCVCVCFV